jgi:VanZ family protein
MNWVITSNRHWRFIFWACTGIVLLLALMPTVPNMPTLGWDKLNHVFAFAFLFVLGRQAYPEQKRAVFFGLFFYGGLIEALQSFTPTRSADLIDLIADGLGLILGWGLNRVFRQFKPTDYPD